MYEVNFILIKYFYMVKRDNLKKKNLKIIIFGKI